MANAAPGRKGAELKIRSWVSSSCRDQASVPWHSLKHGPEALRGLARPLGSEPPGTQESPGRGGLRGGVKREGGWPPCAPQRHFQPLGNSTEASTPRDHRTPRPHGPQASHHKDCGRIRGWRGLPPTFRARRTFSIEGQRVGRAGGVGNLPVKPQVTQHYNPSARKQTLREVKRLTQKHRVTGWLFCLLLIFTPHSGLTSAGETAFFF